MLLIENVHRAFDSASREYTSGESGSDRSLYSGNTFTGKDDAIRLAGMFHGFDRRSGRGRFPGPVAD